MNEEKLKEYTKKYKIRGGKAAPFWHQLPLFLNYLENLSKFRIAYFPGNPRSDADKELLVEYHDGSSALQLVVVHRKRPGKVHRQRATEEGMGKLLEIFGEQPRWYEECT